MDALAQVAGAPLGGGTGTIDMSVYGLFMQADWVVKAIMILLMLASFWSWAIIFEKVLRLRSLKRSAHRNETRAPRLPVSHVLMSPVSPA